MAFATCDCCNVFDGLRCLRDFQLYFFSLGVMTVCVVNKECYYFGLNFNNIDLLLLDRMQFYSVVQENRRCIVKVCKTIYLILKNGFNENHCLKIYHIEYQITIGF